MIKTPSGPTSRPRLLRRVPLRPAIDLRLGTFRPTALDMRFAGDAWIFDGSPRNVSERQMRSLKRQPFDVLTRRSSYFPKSVTSTGPSFVLRSICVM